MEEIARQFEFVIRYSKQPTDELHALVRASNETPHEYLPRAVLADYLDENSHFASHPALADKLRDEELQYDGPLEIADGKVHGDHRIAEHPKWKPVRLAMKPAIDAAKDMMNNWYHPPEFHFEPPVGTNDQHDETPADHIRIDHINREHRPHGYPDGWESWDMLPHEIPSHLADILHQSVDNQRHLEEDREDMDLPLDSDLQQLLRSHIQYVTRDDAIRDILGQIRRREPVISFEDAIAARNHFQRWADQHEKSYGGPDYDPDNDPDGYGQQAADEYHEHEGRILHLADKFSDLVDLPEKISAEKRAKFEAEIEKLRDARFNLE